MTRLLRYLPLVILIITMGLIESSQTSPASAQPGTPQASSDEPVYNPPRKLSPRARIGGSYRGTEGSDPNLYPVVPDHVGLTGKRAPEVNWFLDKPTSLPLIFTLRDNSPGKPIHEGPLPPVKSVGFQTVSLKDLGLELKPDVQYWWFVSAIVDPNSPSTARVAGGVIERCEFVECTSVGYVPACDRESYKLNALRGFWYDAMSCLCNLIKAAPADAQLIRERAALLKQVGLHALADWDLKSIQPAAPAR